ncbi:MAG: Ig-like domain-containing protein [Prevotella sp.]|nr:Ig-like domain-containing protein [Prevotella sp.]
MVRFLKKYFALSFVLSAIALVIAACANMAVPEGGELDFDPPKVLRTSPSFNATNVTRGKIFIDFDENITLDKPSDNVIITPPQKSFPIIQTVNKRLTVELRDTLLANTTYTIDFTSAIKDNNEGNPLDNFSFSFSTGDVVDSMAISGKVLNAENLEPIKGTYVGLHSNMEDTAFTKTRFERISRTSESGEFTIRGVAPGTYRLYALEDANRDYMYDNPAEAIAFFDQLIEPSSMRATRFDTLFVDTARKVVDTIMQVEYTRFLPDNIVMRSFKSNFQRKYLQKYERTPNKMTFLFNAPIDMPEVEPLSFDGSRDWAVLERSQKNDTLVYWIKDQELIKTDTLVFKVTYQRTDSLNQLVPYTDTLRFIDRTRKKSEKELKKEQEQKEKDEREGKIPPPVFLSIKTNLSGTWDTYKNINIEFEEPIVDSLRDKITLQQLKDSVYHDIPFEFIMDSLNSRRYTIKHRWTYDSQYLFRIDSASINGIYGLSNNKLEQKFRVNGEDKYGQLAVRIVRSDTIPAFIELLDKGDKPVRKMRVRNNVAVFRDLSPATYYARVIMDRNNNGVWDTGDFDKQLQPEEVYYYPGNFEIKAFWQMDTETDPWIINPETLAKQKPLEITKQKPQEKEDRRKQMMERNQKQTESENQRRQSTTDYQNGGMPQGNTSTR